MKRFKLLVVMLAVVITLTLPDVPSSAAPSTPAVIEQDVVSDNTAAKWPAVAVGFDQVHLAWSEPQQAQYAVRSDEQLGSFVINSLGSVGSSSTYFNAAVAVGSDGAIHYAWINNGDTIYYQNQPPGQAWSVPQTVAQSEDFANSLSLTVSGSNVFIAWRHNGTNPNGYIRFIYSNDGGVSWLIKNDVLLPRGAYSGIPYLAAGHDNGPVFLTWTGVDGAIYVGQWNGSNFNVACITCAKYGTATKFFNPTIAVGPGETPVVAWRSMSQGNLGVMYATLQQDASWNISIVFPDPVVSGPVSIAVDSSGNTHLAWISGDSGNFDTKYAIKTSSQSSFSIPLVVSNADNRGAFKSDVDMAVCAKSGHSTAHIAWETFTTSGSVITYARVQTNGAGFSVGMVDETVEEPLSVGLATPSVRQFFPMITMLPAHRFFPMITEPLPLC